MRFRNALSAACVGSAVLCVLAIAAVSWTKPQLNWDMLAYVGILYSWTGLAPADVHAATYADAARFASGQGLDAHMAALRVGLYRATMVADADAFFEQLPFYGIRPLYLLAVAAFAKITATVSEATVLVSVSSVCTFSLGLLWFAILKLGSVPGSIVGILFALAPTTSDVAGLSTPDAMLMLWAGAATVLFIGERPLLAACLLTLGVLIRTDLQVFNLCLAAAWLTFARGQPGARLIVGVLASSGLVGTVVNAWAGNYGYFVLYHFTFIESYIPHPASLQGLGIPIALFFRNTILGLRYSLDNGGLWLVLELASLCMALCWHSIQRLPQRSAIAIRALLLAVGASTCIVSAQLPWFDGS